jgi:hypothetical protein
LLSIGYKATLAFPHNIKQLESETVDDYLVRIQTQTCDSGVPESLLVGIMVGGLRPDLAAIVMPQLPKTLQQLRSAPTIAEKTVAITSSKPIAQLTAQVANMAHRLTFQLLDIMGVVFYITPLKAFKEGCFQSLKVVRMESSNA